MSEDVPFGFDLRDLEANRRHRLTLRQRLRLLSSGAEWFIGDAVALAVVGFMVIVLIALVTTPGAIISCRFGHCHDTTLLSAALWSFWILIVVLGVALPLSRSVLIRFADAIIGRASSRDMILEKVRIGGRPYLITPDPRAWLMISEEQYATLGKRVTCHVYSARFSGRVFGAEPDRRPSH